MGSVEVEVLDSVVVLDGTSVIAVVVSVVIGVVDPSVVVFVHGGACVVSGFVQFLDGWTFSA